MHAKLARGFTVIELMAVLAVVAILMTIALPNLREMVVRSQLKSAASSLHSGLFLARSEAIKRNSAATLVPVDASDWSKGWSVKVGTTVLTKQDAFSSISFSTRDAAYNAATVASVDFSGNGRETTSAAGVAFVISSSQYPKTRALCVALDPSGRPKVVQDSNTDPSDGC